MIKQLGLFDAKVMMNVGEPPPKPVDPKDFGQGFDLKKFVEVFPVLAEADGGIDKLRDLVVAFALRGCLVVQNPRDGHGRDLLALASASLPPSRGPRSVQGLDPRPYPIPEGWVWTQAQALGSLAPRNEVSDDATVGFVPMTVVPVDFRGELIADRRRWGDIKKGYTHVADGDVAVAKITPCFQNRKSCVIRGLEGGVGAGTTELLVIRPVSGAVVPEYLLLYFKSPLFVCNGIPRMTGTAGQKRVPGDYFAAAPLPLPPLEEQNRIVAKVAELMNIVDELEAKQTKQREVQTRFQASALDALTRAKGPEEVAEAWQRAAENFEVLFERPDSVEALRLAIHDLAIRGRLVCQRAEDEPASTLLSKLRKTKLEAVSSGKYRRAKPLQPIGAEERTFTIPPSWVWVRLGELCLHVADGPHFSPKYVSADQGVPFLSARNVTRGGVDISTAKYVSRDDHEAFCKRVRPEKGDILYVKGGVNGGVAAVNNLDIEFNVWVHLAVLRLARQHVLPEYVAMALASPYCYRQSKSQTHGIGNLDIGLTRLVLITLPLPPLEEQKRIVAKVEALMKLCDQLEAHLKAKDAKALKLVEAVVRELVGTPTAAPKADEVPEDAPQAEAADEGRPSGARGRAAGGREVARPAAPPETEEQQTAASTAPRAAPAAPTVLTIAMALEERLARGRRDEVVARLGLTRPVLSALLDCKVEIVAGDRQATAKALLAAMPTIGLPLARKVVNEITVSSPAPGAKTTLKAARERAT